MDTYRGKFIDRPDDDDDLPSPGVSDEKVARELPPSPVGQDERRMQVRAYNHWAGLLNDRNFPSIEDLDPEELPDFGPNSVLLDFTNGVDNPAIAFLGRKLADECGGAEEIETLADVPSRSLLSRVTDHYMQILANQAPIGFEAEFINRHDRTILYRGILLPFSSDDDTIDFIYGVINWKELADQKTTDELLSQIDDVLDLQESTRPQDAIANWADGPASDEANEAEQDQVFDLEVEAAEETQAEDVLDLSSEAVFAQPVDPDLPEEVLDLSATTALEDEVTAHESVADFGANAEDDEEDEEDEEQVPSGRGTFDLSRMTGPIEDEYDEEDEAEDRYGEHRPLFATGRQSRREPLDLNTLTFPVLNDPFDPPAEDGQPDESAWDADFVTEAEASNAAEELEAAEAAQAQDTLEPAQAPEGFAEPEVEDSIVPSFEPVSFANPVEAVDLAGWLETAREMAKAASRSEDRGRESLYAAIGQAYDFSLAAAQAPAEFEQLLAQSGLAAQERAPMTPVVKLVFGSDYDKTRLAEFATALNHAHRIGLQRGGLPEYIALNDGGLKGVVAEERRLKREESGKPVLARDAINESLARKLRQLEIYPFEAVPSEGSEFSVLVVRRLPSGEVTILGEVFEDIALTERAARRLLD